MVLFHLLYCSVGPPVKKKKPKLLNKVDKSIKSEIDAAERLRKKVEETTGRHFLFLWLTFLFLWLTHAQLTFLFLLLLFLRGTWTWP